MKWVSRDIFLPGSRQEVNSGGYLPRRTIFRCPWEFEIAGFYVNSTHSSATPPDELSRQATGVNCSGCSGSRPAEKWFPSLIQKRQSRLINLLPRIEKFLRIRVPDIHNSTLVSDFTSQPQEGVTRPAPFRRSPLRGNRVLEMFLEASISKLTSFIIASGVLARSLA